MNDATDHSSSPGGPLRILFVCTANRCRSPLAEAIARSEGEAPCWSFSSAGLLDSGERTPETGMRVASEHGWDLRDHRSRALTDVDLENVDLILTMTREQAREVVVREPSTWPRVFLLTEAADWVAAHPPPPGTTLPEWIRASEPIRSRTELVGGGDRGEIPDPVDRPVRIWRGVATLLRSEIVRLLGVLDTARS